MVIMANIFATSLEEGWTGLNLIAQNIYSVLPQIATAAAFIIIGFILGKIFKKVMVRVLSAAGFTKVTAKTGADESLQKIGYKSSVSHLIGDLIKWIFYLIFFAAALQTLFGQQFLTQIFIDAAAYIPRVVLGIIVLIAGLITGDILSKIAFNFVGRLNVEKGGRNEIASISSFIVKVLIFIFAVIIALNVLNVYINILTVGFGIVMLAIVLFLLLGMKDIIPNIFAGIYIQNSGLLQKGYRVRFGNIQGRVKSVGFIYTILKKGDMEIQIPNSQLLKKEIQVK